MRPTPGGVPWRSDERWLVIGGTGQIGRALVEALPDGMAVTTDRRHESPLHLDLGERDGLVGRMDDLLGTIAPAVVVIAAGMTAVERCEGEPELAMQVNHHAPAVVATRATRAGARCVYLSTEYVFDGRRGPYDETARPRPLSAYGRSKLAGERAVLEADPCALVVRTTVVYGPEVAGKNFAYQLVDHLLRGAVMAVAQDQVSTPTYNRDLARALAAHARVEGAGRLVHLAGPERLSRHAFAEKLAEAAGLETSLVVSRRTADLGQRALRPLDAGLASRVASPPMRTIAEAVEDWRRHPSGRPWPSVVAQAAPEPCR